MPDETPDAGLNAFARALAAAVPHPGCFDRDALLFAAGRAARSRSNRFWRLSTAALALLSAGLGAALVLRPASTARVVEVERVVYLPAPVAHPAPQAKAASREELAPPSTASPAPEWTEGMRLRERVLQD